MRLARSLALAALLGIPATAQDAADPPRGSVIADRVTLDPDGTLTASGGVEIVTPEARVLAAALVYDRETGRLDLSGPIRVETASGDVLLAEGGQLDGELEQGILSGVRLVIDRQLQLAAAELARSGPRYDTMIRAVASSCEVCAANPVPLWEIRAREVVHDRTERQIYFSGAQFRVMDWPVAYLPYLRLPGPGNTRSTGFLAPELVSTSDYGTGISLPYFIVLGPSRDLTLTPSVTSGSAALAARYRQRFGFGSLDVEGSVARGAEDDDLRGHLFAEGRFRLPGGQRLEFDIQETSDDTYPLDYGITSSSLLRNELRVIDLSAESYAEARLTYWNRLRDVAASETQPDRQVGATVTRRRALGGGILSFGADALGYVRTSDSTEDGTDADAIPDGRDGGYLTADAEWRRRGVIGPGLDAAVLLRLDAQHFDVRTDPDYPSTIDRLVPTAATELRWPLRRRSGAVTDVLEPVLALQWSGSAADVPLEEGTRPELDFGNLLAVQRIGGPEGVEQGARAAAGVTWTRITPGATFGLGIGRVFRAEPSPLFASGSGLSGRTGDWLVAGRLASGRAAFEGRVLVDGRTLDRAEARTSLTGEDWDLSAAYVYQETATETDGSPRARISEMALDAGYAFGTNWDADLSVGYDFTALRAQRAAAGLEWTGQCASARADITRRFSSATDLSPETRFGLSVSLTGIAGKDSRPGRCGP